MSASRRPRVRPEVLVRRVGADLAAYDPVADATFILDPASSLVLDLCDGTRSFDDLAGALGERLDLPPESATVLLRATLSNIERLLETREESRPKAESD